MLIQYITYQELFIVNKLCNNYFTFSTILSHLKLFYRKYFLVNNEIFSHFRIIRKIFINFPYFLLFTLTLPELLLSYYIKPTVLGCVSFIFLVWLHLLSVNFEYIFSQTQNANWKFQFHKLFISAE